MIKLPATRAEDAAGEFPPLSRHDRPASGAKRRLDEVVIAISGGKRWLWRAVDRHGVENSRQPTRRRERIMTCFPSPGQAQRFLSVHDQLANLFRTPAAATADQRRQSRNRALGAWAEISRTAKAA